MAMNDCGYFGVLVFLQLVVCMLSYFRIKRLNGELEKLRAATKRSSTITTTESGLNHKAHQQKRGTPRPLSVERNGMSYYAS